MNAQVPVFPPNPFVGQWWHNWLWNGSQWISAGGGGGFRIIMNVFIPTETSFVYMPSPGLVTAIVECQGGGGGGGGAVATYPGTPSATPGYITGGGGGAAGVYARKVCPAALVLGGVIVTPGTAGLGATGNLPGTAGGTTSFGALCVAPGGVGGDPNGYTGPGTPINEWGRGGGRLQFGDPSIIGDFGVAGCAGQAGGTVFLNPSVSGVLVWGGAGGASFWGAAGQQTVANGQNVITPVSYGEIGAGGSGGATGASTSPGVGNRGGGGVCIVTEYCWNDSGNACPQPPDCGSVTAGMARIALGDCGDWNG